MTSLLFSCGNYEENEQSVLSIHDRPTTRKQGPTCSTATVLSLVVANVMQMKGLVAFESSMRAQSPTGNAFLGGKSHRVKSRQKRSFLILQDVAARHSSSLLGPQSSADAFHPNTFQTPTKTFYPSLFHHPRHEHHHPQEENRRWR